MKQFIRWIIMLLCFALVCCFTACNGMLEQSTTFLNKDYSILSYEGYSYVRYNWDPMEIFWYPYPDEEELSQIGRTPFQFLRSTSRVPIYVTNEDVPCFALFPCSTHESFPLEISRGFMYIREGVSLGDVYTTAFGRVEIGDSQQTLEQLKNATICDFIDAEREPVFDLHYSEYVHACNLKGVHPEISYLICNIYVIQYRGEFYFEYTNGCYYPLSQDIADIIQGYVGEN